MSTMTMRPVFGPHLHSHQSDRRALSPGRIALIVAAGLAVAIFSIAAPLAGNPAWRLLRLDNTPTVSNEFDVPSERARDLSPANLWVAVDTIDFDATPVMTMPALEVHAEPYTP